MRKRLSQLLTCAGIVLGLAAAAGFSALIWPDVDLYGNKALRAVAGAITFTILIGAGVAGRFSGSRERFSRKIRPWAATRQLTRHLPRDTDTRKNRKTESRLNVVADDRGCAFEDLAGVSMRGAGQQPPFTLRLHSVLKERIGIEQIGATENLTKC